MKRNRRTKKHTYFDEIFPNQEHRYGIQTALTPSVDTKKAKNYEPPSTTVSKEEQWNKQSFIFDRSRLPDKKKTKIYKTC